VNRTLSFLTLSFFFLLASCSHRKVSSPSAPIARQNRSFVIVIDPGHGGESAGTKRHSPPLIVEKKLTLDCALKVRDYLQKKGYIVRLTRTKDEAVSLQQRVALARQWGGRLFVSIHFNYAPNPQAHGVEVFYYDKPKSTPLGIKSKRLAMSILDRVIANTKANSRGVLVGDFHVIRENLLPAVLIEGGFFSNSVEAKKLANPQYIDTLAYSIAEGINNFVQAR
jgi:N-acetylmuramoyl-L-alanine amidase